MRSMAVANPETEYFENLMRKREIDGAGRYGNATALIQSKIGREIEKGATSIHRHVYLDEDIKSQRQKPQRKIDLLDRQILENEQEYRQAKKQIAFQKKQEQEHQKAEDEIKRREFQEQLARWKATKKEIQQRRLLLQEAKLRSIAEEEELLKKEEADQIEAAKKEKLQAIQESIRQIQINKRKREQSKSQSMTILQNLNPKYIEIAKKYKQVAEEIKFEEDIQKKDRKLSMKIDHQALKAHEKQYLSRVEQRRKLLSQLAGEEEEPKSRHDFNTYERRTDELKQIEVQKMRRRKQFQQKLKEIPVTIDEEKKIKIEIQKDKSVNPLKYHFLGQKSLNDYQIYGQFKDFNININLKEIGNNYLREQQQSSRVNKSSSTSILPPQTEQRFRYKNYLEELKANRLDKNQEQVVVLKTQKEKNRAIEQLNEQSKRYEIEASKKRAELGRITNIKGTFEKSKQADEMYMKALKSKLACLQID